MAFFKSFGTPKVAKKRGEDISNLKLGTTIEISKLSDENSVDFHLSKFERFLSDDELIILVPISNGRIVKLPKDNNYLIIFKTANGLFRNVISILDYLVEKNITLMKVKLLEETTKIQRRACFRLSINIDFKFDLVEENTESILLSSDPILSKGVTEDISNGGIKFMSNEELNEEDLIKSTLILDNKDITTIGTILHKEFNINKKYKYSYKLRYETITADQKDHISKFIFDYQRDITKKGKTI